MSTKSRMGIGGLALLLSACQIDPNPMPEDSAEIEVEVVRYPGQSMVVDLVFSAPDLSVELSHSEDPGVRSERLASSEDTRVRVRGLAPGTSHVLNWVASDPEGETEAGELEFTTNDPQLGYVPSFPVEGQGFEGYLVMDLLTIDPGTASLFVIDGQGVTRWHTGRQAPLFEPDSVFGAARLAADGSLSFVRAQSLYILDELGNEQLRLDSPTIGVPGVHHDLLRLENGNLLTMSYVFEDVDYGDPEPVHVAGDLLIEVTPEGEVVWAWNCFDHLDPLRTREGFEALITDPATGEPGNDWTHGNGLVYEPETDSVLFSMRHQDWIIRVDRATGEIVWRLGLDGDFSLGEGEWFFHQHSPEWQSDGTLVIYDNGLVNPEVDDELEHSRVVRYALDETTMTATQVWQDEDPQPFMAPIGGDADRLDNGSLLINDSSRDMPLGEMHARIRVVDEAQPASPTWTLTTGLQTFAYRATHSWRLPGETDEP